MISLYKVIVERLHGMLQDAEDRELAQTIIGWGCSANRPLSLSELRYIIESEFGPTHQ
jgi:hypothetical protein